MSLVSDDPVWWSFIDWALIYSYFMAGSFTAIIYDWALTFGQEFELVWKQRCSLMSVMYLCVRYAGILYSIFCTLWYLPVSMTDAGCNIIYFVQAWMPIVVNACLGVIMMTRIHAMYQGSKKILVFLIVVLLASTIASGIMMVMANLTAVGEESILSGFHICVVSMDTAGIALNREILVPTSIWEILALFLAVWILIEHFRELRQSPTGSTTGDCFIVLAQSHVLYFAFFAAASVFNLGTLSPKLSYLTPVGSGVYFGILEITQVLQMFVLGPRLILSVRDYNAKLVSDSDEGTGMSTVAFQERGHVSTSGEV